MPRSDPKRYRLHWKQRTGDLLLIRWADVEGGPAAARQAAFAALDASADGAVRIALLRGAGAVGEPVFTGRRGIEDWDRSRALPRSSPNAWSRSIAARRRRLAAANDVKSRLRAAIADGTLDLDGAAKVASALDVALAGRRGAD